MRMVVGFALACCASAVYGQDVTHSAVIKPDTLKWQPSPIFPKGVLVASLIGDPAKTGDNVVLRVKFPANFIMPPHTHPGPEVVTVISGEIGTSSGTTVEKAGPLLPPGSMWVYPPRHPHYAWSGDKEAVVQVQFTAPGGMTYVNPADDPRLQH